MHAKTADGIAATSAEIASCARTMLPAQLTAIFQWLALPTWATTHPEILLVPPSATVVADEILHRAREEIMAREARLARD